MRRPAAGQQAAHRADARRHPQAGVRPAAHDAGRPRPGAVGPLVCQAAVGDLRHADPSGSRRPGGAAARSDRDRPVPGGPGGADERGQARRCIHGAGPPAASRREHRAARAGQRQRLRARRGAQRPVGPVRHTGARGPARRLLRSRVPAWPRHHAHGRRAGVSSAVRNRIKVLIADDHTILREGIRLLLGSQPDVEVVGEACDGRDAYFKVEELRPDVVLMDIAMPVLNGLEATQQIRRNFPDTKVLILTQHDNDEYVYRILQAGASGYVLKRVAGAELVSAIRGVDRGNAFLFPSMTRGFIDDYLKRAEAGQEKASYDGLTERERQILKMIADGCTNQQIADLLCLSVKTVQAHRGHLMEKLNMHDRTELVKYAIRKGIIKVEPEV